MGTLKGWERAIERAEQAVAEKLFGNDAVEAEVVEALLRTCDEQTVVCSSHRTVVPNVYTVELPPHVYAEIGPHLTVVGQELTDRLARHGERKDYEWAGPLAVRLAAAEDVPNGRYQVRCAPMAHITSAPLTSPDT
ncbi:DUF3662 domain-containing protein [Streptomyces subrutilus]|uniref:FhaA N-terminal domain-containing protein n=1 Tax=Streptomyces subrutilus TaxID=36818 RepID=A0A1E5PL76_9ACTN|nr:DUF3662 domain-containing protein [Streptomyces subrutilus]OEJ30297.1 hypothetical protein BGK67_02055 [Streptomyces subrutilus]